MRKGLCPACHQRDYRRRNPERTRESGRRSHAKHKEQRNAASHAYYVANRERLLSQQSARDAARRDEKRAYDRQYAIDNAERLRSYHQGYRLGRRYSITKDEYDALVAQQRNRCAICGGEQTWKNRSGTYTLAIDHDHATGRVRGLLCGPCNTALGHVERAAWLQAALAYLAKARPQG